MSSSKVFDTSMKRKTALLAGALLAAVALFALLSSTAYALPGTQEACIYCHTATPDQSLAPTVTLVSDNGTTSSYTTNAGGSYGIFLVNGADPSTWPTIKEGYGGADSFTATDGQTYEVIAAEGYPGPVGVTSVTAGGGSPPTTYTIAPSTGSNGSITPATTQTVASGGSSTFTIVARSGYHISDVLVDGNSVGAVGTYTFTNVTASHTISASFAQNPPATFTIVPHAGANGSISPATTQTVNQGASSTFTMTPNSSYHVATLIVDGSSVPTATSYTFSNVQTNHTINVTFALDVVVTTYTVSPTAGPNGAISPSTPQVVNAGSNVPFSITPNSGFHVATVTVDAASVGAVTTYTFTNVQANHTIGVTFAADQVTQYTLTYTGGSGGTISGTSPQTVNSGASGSAVTALANSGYHFTGWSDGVLTASRLDSNVTHSISVTANFAANTPTKQSTSLTIASSVTSVVRGKQFTLSGLCTPTPGMVGLMVHVDVKKPGRSFYSYSSNRVVYAGVGGAASWQYKYNTLTSQAKGTYVFHAVYDGNSSYLPSMSANKSVTFK